MMLPDDHPKVVADIAKWAKTTHEVYRNY